MLRPIAAAWNCCLKQQHINDEPNINCMQQLEHFRHIAISSLLPIRSAALQFAIKWYITDLRTQKKPRNFLDKIWNDKWLGVIIYGIKNATKLTLFTLYTHMRLPQSNKELTAQSMGNNEYLSNTWLISGNKANGHFNEQFFCIIMRMFNTNLCVSL